MSSFKVGDKVHILEIAFPGSDDPEDIFARGKIGTIVMIWAGLDGYGDCYEVELDDVPDEMLAIFPLTISEIEKV